jgi:hypothetical protein
VVVVIRFVFLNLARPRATGTRSENRSRHKLSRWWQCGQTKWSTKLKK